MVNLTLQPLSRLPVCFRNGLPKVIKLPALCGHGVNGPLTLTPNPPGMGLDKLAGAGNSYVNLSDRFFYLRRRQILLPQFPGVTSAGHIQLHVQHVSCVVVATRRQPTAATAPFFRWQA